ANGLFNAFGASDFGAGNDLFSNAGTIRTARDGAADETVTFRNLERLDNNGLITMVDGRQGDTFVLALPAGVYNGQANGRLAVDAFLGGPGSTSDVLNVAGNVTGQTAILVSDTNAGPGALNSVGIPVVIVGGTTSAGNFFLPDGPIQKGFYDYDIYLRPDNVWALASTP
ncbi:MAG: autotransporter outer membrane beta-barrel domain-containing protein, partial [Elioraea tepidiphila]